MIRLVAVCSGKYGQGWVVDKYTLMLSVRMSIEVSSSLRFDVSPITDLIRRVQCIGKFQQKSGSRGFNGAQAQNVR